MDPLFTRLKAQLQSAPPNDIDTGGMKLRESAVLAPLFLRDGRPYALLTRRPMSLKRHPGQIAFPGGGREAEDKTPLHTALRELEEEVGIPGANVEVLGMLGGMPTPTGYFIRPFVGAIPSDFTVKPDPREIELIIEAPLEELRPETREIMGATRDVLVWGNAEHVVWGATHRMLRELLAQLKRISAPR